MNASLILDHFRDSLERTIQAQARELIPFAPLDVSPYVAKSLMQKAVRRGQEDLAQRSAATLLKVSPNGFWRRLCVIAFEDVGCGDLGSVARVVAGSTLR